MAVCWLLSNGLCTSTITSIAQMDATAASSCTWIRYLWVYPCAMSIPCSREGCQIRCCVAPTCFGHLVMTIYFRNVWNFKSCFQSMSNRGLQQADCSIHLMTLHWGRCAPSPRRLADSVSGIGTQRILREISDNVDMVLQSFTCMHIAFMSSPFLVKNLM